MDYDKANPRGGVIVHVPHINAGTEKFEQAFAAFLLGAGDGHGFGLGFQYECARGGWLAVDKYPLQQKLGPPLAPAKITAAAWDPTGQNCTYLTAARPVSTLAPQIDSIIAKREPPTRSLARSLA
jgi:hypothetical protein